MKLRETFWMTLYFGWGITMLWLSLDADPPVPSWSWLSWDKIQHALAYGLLTFLGGQVYLSIGYSARRAWLFAFLASLGYGALMEAGQALLTDSRFAQWSDFLANFTGAGIVYAAAVLIHRILSRSA